jgi:hypothetical protein
MSIVRTAYSRHMPIAIAIAATATAAVCVQAHANGAGSRTGAPAGRYADVDGLKVYYQIHGSGRPLILLHGGVGASEMFGANLAVLAKARQVIGVDLQGHGRTADIDRPLSVELMADDVAALIGLVVVSAPFTRSGFYPEILAQQAQVGGAAAEHLQGSGARYRFSTTLPTLGSQERRRLSASSSLE